MPDLSKRSGEKELLDAADVPAETLRQNMLELREINRFLGGHAVTIKGLEALLKGRRKLHVCEIGCGGGNNLEAIAAWCDSRRIELKVTGIDLHEGCLDVAREVPSLQGRSEWIAGDYRSALLSHTPDIIFSSLFCHHFTNDELGEQLRWMRQRSGLGFFINDLHRHGLAYYGIKVITQLAHSHRIIRHDAPLSVARGFKKAEWKGLLDAAGMQRYSISWNWAFRHLIVVPNTEVSELTGI